DGRPRARLAGNQGDRGLGARLLASLSGDDGRGGEPGRRVIATMDLAAVARRLELQDLYAEYAACLDTDALERWPELFTEDCAYRVTSAENYEAGLPLGLIYATSRAMLHDRVRALRDANIYEPQRYRHLISGIRPLRENGTAG